MGRRQGRERRFGSTAIWTPAAYGSRLKLWLDAAVGVDNPGGAVSNWLDQSTFGNHATQGTAALQPTHVTSGGPNDKPYFLWSNLNGDHLILADAASLKPTTISIFMVAFRDTENRTFRMPFGKSTSGAWTNGYGIHTDAAGTAASFFVNHFSTGGIVTTGAGGWADSTWAIWHFRYDLSNVFLDRNQGAFTASAAYTTAITHSTAVAGIGAQAAPTASLWFGGRTTEFLMFDALNDSEAVPVWTYLRGKYAI